MPRTPEEEIAFLEGKIDALKASLKKTKVLVSVVLDESGSMSSCKPATIEGFNAYVDKLLEDKNTEYLITLTKFDTNGNRVLWENKPLSKSIRLTEDNFRPAGGTPLYDALGAALKNTKTVAEKGTNVVFVVLTDGGENASQTYKAADIHKLISDRTKDDWTFMYIGANQDAWSVGSSIGIVNSFNFDTKFSHSNFASAAAMTNTASVAYAMAASPEERNANIKEVRSKTYRETSENLDSNLSNSVV